MFSLVRIANVFVSINFHQTWSFEVTKIVFPISISNLLGCSLSYYYEDGRLVWNTVLKEPSFLNEGCLKPILKIIETIDLKAYDDE